MSDHWVLTAAHCCHNMVKVTMKFGETDLASTEAGEFEIIVDDPTAFYLHEDWNEDMSNGHDVCMIYSAESILATGAANNCGDNCVTAACLPDVAPIHGDACWVAGWGTLLSGGDLAIQLQSTGVNTFM